MGKKSKSNSKDSDIVNSSEEKFDRGSDDLENSASPDEKKLLHGLLVHHIELEMQNEELHNAQLELDKTREKYFFLYNLAPVAYLTISEDGIIEEANITAANLFGLGKTQLIKQPIRKFIIKEDQDVFYLHQNKLLESAGKQQCDLRMRTKEDKVFWVQITSVLLQGRDDNRYSSITITDITERRQAEEQLKFQEQLLGAITEAVLATDINGVIVYSNPAASKLYGWSPEEFIGRNVGETLTVLNAKDENARILENISTGSGWSGKFVGQKKDGKTFDAAVRGVPLLNSENKLVGGIIVFT